MLAQRTSELSLLSPSQQLHQMLMQATMENSATSNPLSYRNWPELRDKGASNGCGLNNIYGWPVDMVRLEAAGFTSSCGKAPW